MEKVRVLTGITTSGTPHLGNYAGAIRPAIAASQLPHVDAFFFMADYHALIKCDDPQRVARSRLEIAATWLAAGLDPNKVTFYRQSDIPEIPELNWILTCLTPKGLMNRAHAYKAKVDENTAKENAEPDDGVNMGLYCYPILMAADILMFNAHKVPVGRDQIQHLEMARDIAQRFNYHYGQGRDYFVLPEVHIDEEVATLPGLDGRKMSKSYNNTIPLFEGGAKALKAAISKIQTDSLLPGQAKDPETSHLYTLYKAFATPQESQAFAQQLREGLGWGDAKEQLYQYLENLLAPMRERYQALMANPMQIEDILQAGAAKARRIATPFIQEIRHAVGLVKIVATQPVAKASKGNKASKGARFVSFREKTGEFKFRLFDVQGEELFCSKGFEQPQVAGQCIKALQEADPKTVVHINGDHIVLNLNNEVIAQLDNVADVHAWTERFEQAMEQLNQADK